MQKRHSKAEIRRGGPARVIADLIPSVGRAAFHRFGFVQSSIVTRWAEIVGEDYARVSAPESIHFPPGERRDGVLNLVVEPAYATFVMHLTEAIIDKVNVFFGYRALVKVRIRQASVQRPRHTATRLPPPSSSPLPAGWGDTLRGIDDPELCAVLESLARSLAAASEYQADNQTGNQIGQPQE